MLAPSESVLVPFGHKDSLRDELLPRTCTCCSPSTVYLSAHATDGVKTSTHIGESRQAWVFKAFGRC